MKFSPVRLLQNLLPKITHYMAIDIGTCQIKAVEIKLIEGVPEVVAVRRYPSPSGVWTEDLDEEMLVDALREVAGLQLKEVVTCIGGEKVISRIVHFPPMSDKEMNAAARFEVEKFVPTPVNELTIRYVRLGSAAMAASGLKEEGQSVLLLAVPTATVFQYHGIFARAGLTVRAVDIHAFALWRAFGRTLPGTSALLDIGAQSSQLVITKDGFIQFARLLPVGGDSLTNHLVNTYGVDFSRAQEMKEEAAVTLDTDDDSPGTMQTGDLLREGLQEITRDLRRSLDFSETQENLKADRLVLSGGASSLKGLPEYLQDVLGIPVLMGQPDVLFSEGQSYDPAIAVALGLALREVAS